MTRGPSISIDTIFQRPDSIFSTDMNDSLALMSLETGNYYGLDSIGKDIMDRIDGKRSVREICAELCVRYDVEPAKCEADVIRLLEKLLQHELIKPA